MRSRFLKQAKAPTLMLTPLLDMFTIILIFLIVSFTAEDYDLTLSKDIELPESVSRSMFKPSVNLAVNGSEVSVEGRHVVSLTEGHAPEAAYAAGEIPELVEHLAAYYDELVRPLPGEERADAPAAGDEPVITVQADRGLDYRTLHLVLQSAAKAGFFKYRLAVLKR
ncbi:MAG: biopolymer transporter ExbD [Deltaproteobacteria bacterium]|nr:biopolymer transporter ExbD [Deltaproteobacteria bacterium]MCB9786083.1 biopolymer transporter ExbD [Deltaproteobacteria bacterium]